AEVGLRQPIALDHRPHCAVEQEDAFREEIVEAADCRHAIAVRERWGLGCGLWALRLTDAFSPLPISTAKGSPALLAPTCTRTSESPAWRSSVSSSVAENPR